MKDENRELSTASVAESILPGGRSFDGPDRRAPLRESLTEAGQFHAGQTAGRFYPMACVALEITQRCNLDCSLCYLSDAAEVAHDVPITVLKRRIDMLHSHYGPGTSIQITGGDPTLRKTGDIAALCRYIADLGIRSCLMTNGIRATRAMLSELARAGLNDVAFHVDMTQERRGYPTEKALNAIRAEYIGRARGLGLRVLFNTTVFEENLSEIPGIVRFFRDHANDLALVSFQLQADAGRGVLRSRADEVSQESVMDAIQAGFGTTIDFGSASVGHASCNRYASLLIAGEQAVDLLDDRPLVGDMISALERQEHRVDGHLEIAATLRRTFLKDPRLALRALRHGVSRLWALRGGLWKVRGRASRLSVLVHNFMDSKNLDAERCKACVFMVATEDGPLSMCVHNARRDHYLFQPARMKTEQGGGWWSAATGQQTGKPHRPDPGSPKFKHLKGRLRARAEAARKAAAANNISEKTSEAPS